MNFINKLERKFGKYAIHNLMYYIIILYVVGYIINLVNPYFYTTFLQLDANAILHGQIWRIVTFLITPPGDNIFIAFIACYLYYMLGTNLERTWGAFKFNLYFFVGVIGIVLANIVVFLITGVNMPMDTTFLNLSLFFAFALMYPDLQFLFMFIIPVKAKWLALLNGAVYIYLLIVGGWTVKLMIIMSLANFIIFFFLTKDFKRMSPSQVKRRAEFKKSVRQANKMMGGTRHKCAVCGRTEKDGDDLVFRYCSKCEGNYEYCQDHLYTHKHVTKQQ